MKKRSLKLNYLASIFISILLINPVNVLAGVKNTGEVSLPEYQQTSNSTNVNTNISDEEKEKLLNKYFNDSSSSKKTVDFATAKKQLEKAGYTVVEDSDGSFVVGKTIKGNFWVGMTLYSGTDVDVDGIKTLFNTYAKLKEKGYDVKCSGLVSSYLYFSHGKSPYGAAQITGNKWTISKDGVTVKLNAFDDNGKALTFNKAQESIKFEKAKKQLKKDGFKVIQDSKNPDAWIVTKKIKGETVCFTIYPFNEKGKCTVNVKSIKKMFNLYKDLKKAGYKVNCSGKTDLYYYFSLGKGQSFTQLTTNDWTISKGKTKVKLSYFDNDGKALTLSKVKDAFKFEKAKTELKKAGFKFVQDSKNPDAWIASKKIKGETTCLTVYPFNEKGKCTINVTAITGLFKLYKDLKNKGYKINCAGKTNLYYYFSLGKGQSYTQITGSTWTITKGNKKIKFSPFDDNGKVRTAASILG